MSLADAHRTFDQAVTRQFHISYDLSTVRSTDFCFVKTISDANGVFRIRCTADEGDHSYYYHLADLASLQIWGTRIRIGKTYFDIECNGGLNDHSCDPSGKTERLGIAIAVILHRGDPKWRALDQVRFEQAIAQHRGKPLTATEKENLHRAQVIASADINDKHFQEAADTYDSALHQSPWWAAGHFNRALILGGTEGLHRGHHRNEALPGAGPACVKRQRGTGQDDCVGEQEQSGRCVGDRPFHYPN